MASGTPEDARLSLFYRLYPWVEDPYTPEGRSRYEAALRLFRELVRHRWLEELSAKGELKVLDLCGGVGTGGVALAKAFSERGVKACLTVLDLREEALRVAERFGRDELGEPPETRKADAQAAHLLGERFDAVLLYGLSTPHFDAFSMVQLLASTSSSLEPGGMLLVEEGDRFQSLVLQGRYQHVFYEGDENGGVLSLHLGYDPLRGVVKRMWLSPFTGERVALELRYWDLAAVLALTWLFFEELDFVEYPGRRATGMILARRPRGRLKPEELRLPELLRKP